jgi:hypothetical protein
LNGFFVPKVGRLALTVTAFSSKKNTMEGRNTDYKNAKAMRYKKQTR